MIESLLFQSKLGEEFDPTKTKMTVSHLIDFYKKKEVEEFDKKNK